MRAYQITSFEMPPALAEAAVPEPSKGEIRVKIGACGLNFADLLMTEGKYQDTPQPPFTLGMEVAGTVDAIDPETDAPPVGSRVAVFGGQGGLAEYGQSGHLPLLVIIALADVQKKARLRLLLVCEMPYRLLSILHLIQYRSKAGWKYVYSTRSLTVIHSFTQRNQ